MVQRLSEPSRAAVGARDRRAARPAVHHGAGGPAARVRPHRPVDRVGRAAPGGGRRGARPALPGRYGPSSPADFAAWAGIEGPHARALWDLVPEEEEPKRAPRRAKGVRLLAPGDPLLLARDRGALVPDADLRRRVFRPTGSPGVVLQDGELAGLWRARRKGKRLEVEVSELGTLDLEAVRREAERIAPLRGCTDVAVGSARS